MKSRTIDLIKGLWKSKLNYKINNKLIYSVLVVKLKNLLNNNLKNYMK
jgi:hypothetical protein